VLSEARKYRLGLTLANQYLAQMNEATATSVFGNAGSLISFAVGAEDAETLAAQLGAPLTPQDLQALPKHEAYARLLIDGLPSRPFSIRPLSPAGTTAGGISSVARRGGGIAGRNPLLRRRSRGDSPGRVNSIGFLALRSQISKYFLRATVLAQKQAVNGTFTVLAGSARGKRRYASCGHCSADISSPLQSAT
jgi:hypothetical protein